MSFILGSSNTNTYSTSQIDAMFANLTAEISAGGNNVSGYSTLSLNLSQEQTTRAAADTTLQNNINNVQSTLQNSITTEASTRASTDTSLQSQITAEVTNRQTAVSNLSSTVSSNNTTLTTALNSEVSTRSAQVQAINTTLAGVNGANGLCQLDASGLVPIANLPSSVQDIISLGSKSLFPSVGTSAKIYIAQDTNLCYVWSTSTLSYQEVSSQVQSVNTQTGAVVLTTGNISSVLNNRYVTDAQLANVNTIPTMTANISTNASAITTANTNIANLTTSLANHTSTLSTITDFPTYEGVSGVLQSNGTSLSFSSTGGILPAYNTSAANNKYLYCLNNNLIWSAISSTDSSVAQSTMTITPTPSSNSASYFNASYFNGTSGLVGYNSYCTSSNYNYSFCESVLRVNATSTSLKNYISLKFVCNSGTQYTSNSVAIGFGDYTNMANRSFATNDFIQPISTDTYFCARIDGNGSVYWGVPQLSGNQTDLSTNVSGGFTSMTSTETYTAPTAWTPSTLNSTQLRLWYDMSDNTNLTLSGSTITAIKDKSGNGLNSVAVNYLTQVTNFANGRNVCQFVQSSNGANSNSFYEAPSTALPSSGSSFCVVTVWYYSNSQNIYGSSSQPVIMSAAEGSYLVTRWYPYYSPASIAYMSGGTWETSTTNLPSVNQWVVWTYEYNAATTTTSLYQNGYLIGSTVGAATWSSTYGLTFGTLSYADPEGWGGNYGFAGYNAETIILSSNTYQQQAEGYVAWKYGAQANLISTHPYYSAAPIVGNSVSSTTPSLPYTSIISASINMTVTPPVFAIYQHDVNNNLLGTAYQTLPSTFNYLTDMTWYIALSKNTAASSEGYVLPVASAPTISGYAYWYGQVPNGETVITLPIQISDVFNLQSSLNMKVNSATLPDLSQSSNNNYILVQSAAGQLGLTPNSSSIPPYSASSTQGKYLQVSPSNTLQWENFTYTEPAGYIMSIPNPGSPTTVQYLAANGLGTWEWASPQDDGLNETEVNTIVNTAITTNNASYYPSSYIDSIVPKTTAPVSSTFLLQQGTSGNTWVDAFTSGSNTLSMGNGTPPYYITDANTGKNILTRTAASRIQFDYPITTSAGIENVGYLKVNSDSTTFQNSTGTPNMQIQVTQTLFVKDLNLNSQANITGCLQLTATAVQTSDLITADGSGTIAMTTLNNIVNNGNFGTQTLTTGSIETAGYSISCGNISGGAVTCTSLTCGGTNFSTLVNTVNNPNPNISCTSVTASGSISCPIISNVNTINNQPAYQPLYNNNVAYTYISRYSCSVFAPVSSSLPCPQIVLTIPSGTNLVNSIPFGAFTIWLQTTQYITTGANSPTFPFYQDVTHLCTIMVRDTINYGYGQTDGNNVIITFPANPPSTIVYTTAGLSCQVRVVTDTYGQMGQGMNIAPWVYTSSNGGAFKSAEVANNSSSFYVNPPT